MKGSDADEARFSDYAATLTRQLAITAAGIIALCLLLWWPLDHALMPDQRHVEAFQWLRLRALAVMGLTMLASWWVQGSHAVTAALSTLCYLVFLGVIGYSLGAIGDQDMGWLADAYLGLVPSALIPMPLAWRALATPLIGLSLYLCFFLPHGLPLDTTGARGQLSFLLFAVLFTVAAGELLDRVIRRAFFERCALDRANASLNDLTDNLSAQVSERTRALRALAGHLDKAQEAERARIARDLHDDLGQHLTAMRYAISRMERGAERRGDRDALLLLEDLSALLDGTHQSTRAVIARLRPRVLQDLGLLAAAEWLCEQVEAQSSLPCHLRVENTFAQRTRRLPPEDEEILFRVLQESTTNALKYARATALWLTLRQERDAVVVEVHDDGVGFDPQASASGFGLLGLRERVHERGGAFHVSSSPGGGAAIRASLPLSPQELP
jgi:signal transduction histidine kinase